MTSEKISCSLSPDAAADQLMEWTDLQALATRVERTDDGVRLTLPVEHEHRVTDLAARERACCSFLTITTETSSRAVTVTVESSLPAALPVITLLTGPQRTDPGTAHSRF